MSDTPPNEVLIAALDRLADGIDLSEAESAAVLEEIMSGQVGEAQTAGFLMALRAKGESVAEIVGLARTMRSFATRVSLPTEGLVDTCGTGGDRSGSFNISTTAAFVVAGAGGRVAKHGNRSATSQCGSADVLEALGAKLEIAPETLVRSIEEAGICFLFAPAHHQAMKHVVPVRRQLGVRTIFNFLGPLTNPAGAPCQVMGVSDRRYLEPLAQALKALGCAHGLVVHGQDGLDEITVTAATDVAELSASEDEIRVYELEPEQFGIRRLSDPDALKGGDAATNAAILRAILDGEAGPRRDIVVLNAAAALYAAGVAGDMADGISRAASSIDSGAARERLKRFIALTGGS